jgi:hypothetical protein
MSERFICPFSARVGDKGQRYEVWCLDSDGTPMQVGYSDQSDGGSLTQMVSLHPSWHSPWIVDRHQLPEYEDIGDVSDHILRAAGVRAI